MNERLSLAELGLALAEPTRLHILQELLGGVPLPAGALAARIGVSPSTVSSHLARLEQANLIRVSPQGRSRLATIANAEVAEAVEVLLRLSSEPAVSSLPEHRRRAALREARTCYDHLAGSLGVALADLALERGWVVASSGAMDLVEKTTLESNLGLRIELLDGRRADVRACMDWTERRPHLAGKLGAGILTAMLDANWLERRTTDRSVKVTRLGDANFVRLGIAAAL